MRAIAEPDIKRRLERDNPWWADHTAEIPEAAYPKRVYFEPFAALALNFAVRRAAVLLGPRRVGKTVMIKQLISEAKKNRINNKSILYASIDAPVYSGISLERFIDFMPIDRKKPGLVIFDEIQYLKDWEIHLKDLVDNYPDLKFIATGSAAAALRLKSRESGAGRFSEFMLPPLTFFEFLKFIGKDEELMQPEENQTGYPKIKEINKHFLDYLNFGGYPEAVLNEDIRKNPDQFIKNDIIDKVLLKDLPSLYGIDAIQELNKLFSFLAYNAGNEASLENISQESGLTKPTIKKYIEYLESAFLIMKISTVDDNCRTPKRERNFKIYLNNPSMRAALFAPVEVDDTEKIGHLAESAIFSQWQHAPQFRQLRYARWRNEGEVDIAYLHGPKNIPRWIGEIKWSDRISNREHEETRHLVSLMRKHREIKHAFFTTKTISKVIDIDDRCIHVLPSAIYCYYVGENIMSRLDDFVVDYKWYQ